MAKYKNIERYSTTKRCQGPREKASLMNAVSNIRWDDMYALESCADQFTLFNTVMSDLVDTHLPLKTVSRNSDDRPWITDSFRHLISLRQYHHKAGNDLQYRLFRNRVNRERKRLKARYFSSRMVELKQLNPKDWWNNIKEITGQRRKNNNLQPVADVLCQGSMVELAGEINKAFKAVTEDMVPITPADDFALAQDVPSVIPAKYIVPCPWLVDGEHGGRP